MNEARQGLGYPLGVQPISDLFRPFKDEERESSIGKFPPEMNAEKAPPLI